MKIEEIKQKLDSVSDGMDLIDLEKFRRYLNLKITKKRKIWDSEITKEIARQKIESLTQFVCQGALTGWMDCWWWSEEDDPEQKHKPTEISDEAISLASMMIGYSFYMPIKGRYTEYVDVRDHVAAILYASEFAEDYALLKKRPTNEQRESGKTSAAIYYEFLKFFESRKSVEEDYPDGMHLGDCTKVAISCNRCMIDAAREDAESLMHREGWILQKIEEK